MCQAKIYGEIQKYLAAISFSSGLLVTFQSYSIASKYPGAIPLLEIQIFLLLGFGGGGGDMRTIHSDSRKWQAWDLQFISQIDEFWLPRVIKQPVTAVAKLWQRMTCVIIGEYKKDGMILAQIFVLCFLNS